MPLPILLLSDSADQPSGLSRITRDLAYGLSRTPEFRVATMGRGGYGSSKLPFPQFVFPDDEGWGAPSLERNWRNFAGNEKGILMTIWDASRLRYLVDPRGLPPQLAEFLKAGHFERWGYFPVDSTGPDDRLTGALADIISRFERPLAYGLWGKSIIENSIGREVDWLPHGIDQSKFQPRDRIGARLAAGFPREVRVIGMVATNQARKDWGLAFQVFKKLVGIYPGIRFWLHVDELIRHWNLYALAQDFGIAEHVTVTLTGSLNDEELSWHYSACDLTILPSSEGFGYPLVESLACGVPVIHSSYAGGAELIPNRAWRVDPTGWRYEGIYNCKRPVWEPQPWVDAIVHALDQDWDRAEVRRSVSHLDWQLLWEPWRRWFLKGIGK